MRRIRADQGGNRKSGSGRNPEQEDRWIPSGGRSGGNVARLSLLMAAQHV